MRAESPTPVSAALSHHGPFLQLPAPYRVAASKTLSPPKLLMAASCASNPALRFAYSALISAFGERAFGCPGSSVGPQSKRALREGLRDNILITSCQNRLKQPATTLTVCDENKRVATVCNRL